MKVSVCLTVLNEESSIAALLNSLLTQTKSPNEIVIVDGGSKDRTLEIIRHYQKKDRRIKLLREKCSRARGRNLGVEIARYPIIAMTDAGCIAQESWLEQITKPFVNLSIDMVAGFYQMEGKTPFQKACSVFLGITPIKFDAKFLPSTRSIAFRKKLWEKLGGFPENLKDTAEDTVFNYKALKAGTKISRVKSARVEWRMPETHGEFLKKIYKYAIGDAKTKIFLFPSKGFASHNIKAILIILRYLLGIFLVISGFKNPLFWVLLVMGLFFYTFWAIRKVYLVYPNWRVGIWGPIIQIFSDMAVMAGFAKGFLIR